jgi:hypothetical protein
MRILLRGNVSSIEVEGSWEIESERDLIGCEAKTLLQDLFKDSCFDHALIDADWRYEIASLLDAILWAISSVWALPVIYYGRSQILHLTSLVSVQCVSLKYRVNVGQAWYGIML